MLRLIAVTFSVVLFLQKTYALDFLNQKQMETSPFFMMLATPAAHAPFTPAPRHEKLFPDAKAVRTPSFNYSSSDVMK